jgi:tetratricopeptide (TPR) repeat protein
MATAGVKTGYSFGAAAAILGISESRLRYWSQVGFVGPSLRVGGRQVYSFQDLVSVKAAKELVDRGFSTAEIRRALERVRTGLPAIDRPLDRLRVAFDGEVLVVLDDGAAFELSGQRVFDFGLAELKQRASSWDTSARPIDGVSTAPGLEEKSAHAWLQEGLRHEDDGRDEDAAGCYRRALKLDPGLAAAHTNQGALAYRRGDRAEARTCFEAALGLDPDQPEARYNLANLIFESGDMELAVAELRRVLQLRPDFADAHFNLASALEALGGKRQAREHLLRYLELTADRDESVEPWAAEARARLQLLD